ncbi:MAG: serine/threonine protein kinase [Betaproteobacteria bacterium]|nr:serine/threonine protein kinase [Betaproteobacteria bacterium]
MPLPDRPVDLHPYSRLTPDVVLDALDSVGLRGDGRMLALNSYENRVYQLMLEEGPYAPANPPAADAVVAKFYRPDRWSDAQIVEEHAFALELAEREIPVVAPLVVDGRSLHEHGGFRFAVYPRRGGRPPEFDDPKTLEWIGRFIGRIHAIGSTRRFDARPALDAQSFGREPRDWLLASGLIPADLVDPWRSAADLALAEVAHCYQRAGATQAIRLHGDCHAGNILWTADGPHFVDLDDCRSGPAVQDLWMLLSGDAAAQAPELASVLAGYEMFHAFDRRELHLVEALRTLRLLHYCAWLARRWDDPAFPAAFPWFGTQRYWQDRILELREQIGLMQEASPVAA